MRNHPSNPPDSDPTADAAFVNRRVVLRGMALAGLAAFIPACSDDDAEPAATPDPTTALTEGDAPTEGAEPTTAPAERVTLRLPGPNVNLPTPFTYLGGIGFLQASYIYDTLLWKDGDGNQIPWLAESHERSPDGLELTFTLRDGVMWHDGEPLTANDVAFTFDYLRENASIIAPSVIARPPFDTIAAVTARNERTAVFELTRPDWTVEQFAGAGAVFIVPEHIWVDIDEPNMASDPAVLVGSGPWQLESFEPGTGANLYVANDDHFMGPPVVERIEHRPVQDALVALQSGDVDQAGGVGPGTGLRPQVVEPFSNDDAFEVFDTPGHTCTALYFEPDAHPALADPTFRQAVAQAINRQQLVDQLFDGAADVGNSGLLPDTHAMYAPTDAYAYDLAAAETALDSAGYPRRDGGLRVGADGAPLSFELLISTMQPDGPVQLVIADLAAVGIEATPVAVELPVFHQRRNMGETQLSINTFGGTNTDEPPLNKVYNSQSQALQRARGYQNDQVDALLADLGAELDPDRRIELAGDIQRLVAQDLPLLPLFYPPLVTIVRTESFNGWRFTPGGVGGLVPSVNDKHTFITGGAA